MVWPRVAPGRLYLAGTAGASKGLVAEHLVTEYVFHRVGLGGLRCAKAEHQGWALDRVHVQAAGVLLRAGNPAALTWGALEAPVPGGLRSIVIDGARLPAEADLLRRSGYLGVGLSASEWTGARRSRARGEPWPVLDHDTERLAGEVQIE